MRDLIDVPSSRREQLDNFALVETITVLARSIRLSIRMVEEFGAGMVGSTDAS
jgi:hypothetical protein